MKNIEKLKIARNIMVFIIIILIIILGINIYEDNLIKDKKSDIKYESKGQIQVVEQEVSKKKTENKEKTYPKVKVASKYKGYKVMAKLDIPKINLETYILENYSESSLKVSVTKFWGVDANEIGNFCVAGHNYIRKNMFHNLKKLRIGDTLTLSDNKIGKVKYKIFDIYKVNPSDVSCLSQKNSNTREITLITCTSDSKKRIIVKAREV